MTDRIVRSRLFNSFADRIIPLITWTIITFPLWMSPFHPAVVAYFIIAFDIYFFYKSLSTVYHASVSFQLIMRSQKIPFAKKLLSIPRSKILQHFVVIPNYKEPLHKLVATIQNIIKSDYPYKQIYIVLAFERIEDEASEKDRIIRAKFKRYNVTFLTYYHSLVEYEVAGKASNQTFAVKQIYSYCAENQIKPKNALITICDADSLLPDNYFSYLTVEYLKDVEHDFHFYWAPVLLYSNFWQLPFFVRMQATLSSIVRLAFLSQKENLIQISTYTTNLWLLHEVNYWDVDIIPEDWHIYFQAFFKFGKKIKTLPLYTLINADAVFSGGIVKTLANRYEQEKRWAWGVSDTGYMIRQFFITPHVGIKIKLKKLFYLIENHVLWPTSFFILTVSASIPPLINPLFKRTVLGFILPKLSGLILTLASSMLLVYVYLDIKLRSKVKINTQIRSLPFLIIQWYFLPVISFFLSSLPALESHTRLLFGKKLKYKVTEKV